MNYPIHNKHLCKIIDEYLLTELVFESELLYKTRGIRLKLSQYWWYSSKFIKYDLFPDL